MENLLTSTVYNAAPYTARTFQIKKGNWRKRDGVGGSSQILGRKFERIFRLRNEKSESALFARYCQKYAVERNQDER